MERKEKKKENKGKVSDKQTYKNKELTEKRRTENKNKR